MSTNFEKEMSSEGALISGEVILESFSNLLDYYPLVLGASLRRLSELLNQPVKDILAQLEEQEGMLGVLEISSKQLSAGKEVLGSLLGLNVEE